MPKRPRYIPEPPEIGDIWEDCYEGREEKYLLLKDVTLQYDLHPEAKMYLTLDLQTGQMVHRDLRDWERDWLKRA